MAFPTTEISTTNLDADTDSPAAARPDLLSAVQALNNIIDSAGGANGVPVLNASGKLDAATLPNEISSAGTMTLSPSNSVVALESILRMSKYTVAETATIVGSSSGDIIVVSDGDAGSLCMAMYDGTNWKKISLGATISAT
jgi:hypothetical protein